MFVPVARLVRNQLPESWHLGAAAIVKPGGELVARLGDPQLPVYLRSSAKPFQIQPLLAAGGETRFALDDADLALICASHSGTEEHAARAQGLLDRGGFTVSDLLCGAHPPLDPEIAAALAARGPVAGTPTPLHNNCSGKHAGMLLACRALDLPTAHYVDLAHPLQQQIRAVLADVTGLEEREIQAGIDGCSAPAFHLSLAAGARAYAALADPLAAGLRDPLARGLRRAADAMAAAPEMVAGPRRFTTALMRETGGRILGKEGAEGVYGLAIRGPVALGVLLKIADGGERARDAVVLELLAQLGAISGEELERLATFRRVPQRNHRGILVGSIEPDLELEPPE